MGSVFDKIKKAAGGHKDKVEQGAEKLKDVAKQKTGGKYDEKIDKAGDSATGYLTGEQSGNQEQAQNEQSADQQDRNQQGRGGSGEERRG